MAYFEWADDMVVDHGPIDDDHRRLVDLVNRLHTATATGEGREVVGDILGELVRYTRDHLQREERLMADAGFAGLDEHRRGHARLVQQLDALVQRQAGGSVATAALVSALLRDWLSLHIRRSDHELRHHLAQGRRPAGRPR